MYIYTQCSIKSGPIFCYKFSKYEQIFKIVKILNCRLLLCMLENVIACQKSPCVYPLNIFVKRI